jgi:hypothetical protein
MSPQVDRVYLQEGRAKRVSQVVGGESLEFGGGLVIMNQHVRSGNWWLDLTLSINEEESFDSKTEVLGINFRSFRE